MLALLAKFLNLVAPRYDYELLAIEQNDELNQHLNLPEEPVRNGWYYFSPFGEELAEQLEDWSPQVSVPKSFKGLRLIIYL